MSEDNSLGISPSNEPLVLEGYDFVESLGSSPLSKTGMYLDLETKTHVVIKEIRTDVCQVEGFAERFQEKISSLAEVEHPILSKLLGYGQTSVGNYYIIREHAEGSRLRTWMQTTGIDPISALNIIISLSDAVQAYNHHGTVHGAVRPSNIWISQSNDVKLDGFPVAPLLEPAQLVSLLGLDVVNAMPPEFTTGSAPSAQGDIYSLAAIYYEMVTGSAPHGIIGQLPASAQVDCRISPIILKALSHDPTSRQTCVSEFSEPLLSIATAEPIPTAPSQVEQPDIKSYGNMTKPLIAIVCLALTMAGTGWFMWRQAKEENKKIQSQKEQAAAKISGKDKKTIVVPSGNPFTADVVITPQIKQLHASGNAERIELTFALLNQEEVMPFIQISETEAPGEETAAEPSSETQYYFEDSDETPLGKPVAVSKTEEGLVFGLTLDITEDVPETIRLKLIHVKEHTVLTSDFIPLANTLADHRAKYSGRQGNQEDITTTPLSRKPPTASPSAGDAYIYAAHFYLGDEVSLLKIQFGNAGKIALRSQNLAFQCAFSIDASWDPLAAANSGAMPEYGRDLAAGGFTSTWLGHQSIYLMPSKKIWTKHTFRIDTSNPELLKTAKFLLIKISPHYSIIESNYVNNTIAIPLDHRAEWHSVTQDTSDSDPPVDKVPPGGEIPQP